jgi:hypothetical protein
MVRFIFERPFVAHLLLVHRLFLLHGEEPCEGVSSSKVNRKGSVLPRCHWSSLLALDTPLAMVAI